MALTEDWEPLILVEAGLTGTEPTNGRVPWRSLADVVPDLVALEPPDGTLVELIGPLARAARPGDPLSSATAGVATVGLPIALTAPQPNGDTEGFLTVAHGTPPLGGAVSVPSAAGGTASGAVLYRDDSAAWGARGGGDDIALVTLPPNSLAGLLNNVGVQAMPSGPPYAPLPCDLYASQSGQVLAQVNGALLQLGDRTWQWRDCWELGGTTPLMRPGDSGSVAIGPNAPHSIFGHFVGGAINLRGTGGFTHHWVQDLGQVLGRHPALASLITF